MIGVPLGQLPSTRYDTERIAFARELMNRGFTDEQIVRAIVYEFQPQGYGRPATCYRSMRKFVRNVREDDRWQAYVDYWSIELALRGQQEAYDGLTHEERFIFTDLLHEEYEKRGPDWFYPWARKVGIENPQTVQRSMYKRSVYRRKRRAEARSGVSA